MFSVSSILTKFQGQSLTLTFQLPAMMGWRAHSSVPALIVACLTENASAVVAREARRRAAENFMVRRAEVKRIHEKVGNKSAVAK